ncbi:TPA: Asp-tRNA(Asn)/Glu-tRNA(Gln) amidotransferase subunit GatA [Candidatus Woesearchaeota archaeon]|nr:Asp-tRNA(Asn)/Glu-tRNA(Gln) amidotransferase subunit GatA [Candidatus Woesearchaeota archaeon]
MDARELAEKVRARKIDPVQSIKEVLQKIKRINAEYHYFTTICEENALEQAEQVKRNPKGKLAGVPVSVKDCICVKGVESAAGSRILEGYKPVFDATAVELLREEGAIIIGKTSQDEFGFGGFSANVGIGHQKPLNPFDRQRSCGGSSGGSAGITQKADFPHISLAESTGGSIVNPASFCGVVGLCPTYGAVSRYGLLDYANSLDKIGPMAKSIAEARLMFDIIAQHDEKDATSVPHGQRQKHKEKNPEEMRIGIISYVMGDGIAEPIQEHTKKVIERLRQKGIACKEVALPTVKEFAIATYYLLATAEASTNLAKYCGMRYGKAEQLKGNFNDYFSDVRSRNFGKEAKRRVILGTFARMAGYRDAYYLKAAKVRTKIIEEYRELFKSYDALLSPTVPILPPTFEEIGNLTPLAQYMLDALTVGPNLAGLPHMNLPSGNAQGLPVGTLLTADHFNEHILFRLGEILEG